MNKNNSHIDEENLNFLNGISKKNNFKTPAGYFEELASNLETKLEVKNAKSPKKGVVRNIIINLSIAAAVLIGVFVFKPSTNQMELPEFLGEAVTVDDFMESMIDDPEANYDFIAEIDQDVSIEHEVAAMLSEQNMDPTSVTSDELLDVFEDDWDEYDYEF